jgi:RimJ/RimL family protein N-acetyltransferase
MSSNPQHVRHTRARKSEPVPLRPGIPGMREPTLRLSIPGDGIRTADVVLRPPRVEDIDAMMPAFSDPEIREAGNLPNLDREEMLQTLPHLPALAASGRLLPLVAADAARGEVLGGGTLHHLDAERAIVEIGYWLLPHARGRGVATRIARLLAEHAFSLGVRRVEAYVNVGNSASDRVLERARFTREGVARSLPKPDGTRVDKTVYSLLPAD